MSLNIYGCVLMAPILVNYAFALWIQHLVNVKITTQQHIMSSEPSTNRKPSVAKSKRGNKGRNQRQSTNPYATSLSSDKFVGETKELHGHIYDINKTKQ